MKGNLIGIAFVCLVAGPLVAGADTIEDVNFTYTDPANGNLTATGTLVVDVTTDQALSGSGTLNSSLFVNAGTPNTPMGNRSFFLVTTSNCAATSPNCVIPSPFSGSSTFAWADSDGTQLPGNTYFNVNSSPYVSSDNTAGLLFAVGNLGAHGSNAYDSFLIYADGANWGDFLGAGGPAQSSPNGGTQVYSFAGDPGGTLTINSITPVPLPAALPLLLCGLGGLGTLAVRRRKLGLV
jgi:hypothetical protein